METDSWLSMGSTKFELEGCLEVTEINVKLQTIEALVSKAESSKELGREFARLLYLWQPRPSLDALVSVGADQKKDGSWVMELTIKRAEYAIVEFLLGHGLVDVDAVGDEIGLACAECGKTLVINKKDIPRLPHLRGIIPCDINLKEQPHGIQS